MYKKIRKFFNYLTNFFKTAVLQNMPALYDIVSIKPTSCNIMITNRCNLKCVMCRQWKERPATELSTEWWKRVIRDLKDNGICNIHFTGGEPLLRQDLLELIKFCTDLGLITGMTTNGMLLTKEKIDTLIDAGIRSIALSIDALGADYEKIRGVTNSFDKLKESAALVADAKKEKGIDAYINFTLMRDNLDKAISVKKFADELSLPFGLCLVDKSSSIFNLEENKSLHWIEGEDANRKLSDLLRFLRQEMISRPGSLILNFPALKYIEGYFKDPRQAGILCVISQDRIFIDPYGNLLGGCLSMGSFGNVKDVPFGKLLRDKKYRVAARNMLYKRCEGCSCGYIFNIRHMPALILADYFERAKSTLTRK